MLSPDAKFCHFFFPFQHLIPLSCAPHNAGPQRRPTRVSTSVPCSAVSVATKSAPERQVTRMMSTCAVPPITSALSLAQHPSVGVGARWRTTRSTRSTSALRPLALIHAPCLDAARYPSHPPLRTLSFHSCRIYSMPHFIPVSSEVRRSKL